MNSQAQGGSASSLVGRSIDGRYELVRQLAQGGMGAVYEARNSATGKRCAIKLLLTSELGPDSPPVRRLLQESRISSAVESDYIVQVFDAALDTQSGAPYIVMELLRGEDLRALGKRLQVLPPEAVSRLALHAALGLSKAHAAGVVHRDIKPANLFLTERDNGEYLLKVVDFGVAKLKSGPGMDSLDSLTQSGHVVGTPAYMSPEQARGERDAGADCDVWALGIVMYELLTGALPYSVITPLATLMAAIVTEPIEPLQQRAAWVPPELARIVGKALSRDRRERYRDAGQLRDDLLEVCRGDTRITRSLLRTLPPGERTQTAPPDTPFLGDDQRETRDLPGVALRAPRRRRLGATLLVAVGATIAFAGHRWQRGSPSAETAPAAASRGAPRLAASVANQGPQTAPVLSVPPVVNRASPSASGASTAVLPRRLALRAASALPAAGPANAPAKPSASASRQRAQLSDAVDEFR